ncbi:MAG: twin-arginine translocase TatA/TatE family subunit [Candidatus Kapaibacterium sp.]
MFDIGGGELILIILAVLVLFGPKKIPEIAQMIGKGVQQVKKAQSQFETQMRDIEKDVRSAAEVKQKPIDQSKSEHEKQDTKETTFPPAKGPEETDDRPADSSKHGFTPRKPSRSIEHPSENNNDNNK